MKKRMTSLFLALALCLGLLPLSALAAGTTVYGTIEVGGVALTNSESTPTVYATTDAATGAVTAQPTFTETDGWNIKWDGSTLTLRNATIQQAEEYSEKNNEKIAIYLASGDMNLALVGQNTVDAQGNGKAASCGINLGNGSLTIRGEEGASLSVFGGDTTNTTKANSCGIYANGAITINSGTVTVTGESASGDSYGIYPAQSFTVTGGTVTAESGKAGGSSFGIRASGAVTIEDGTVKATSGEAQGDSCGIFAEDSNYKYNNSVTINGGTVTAMAGDAVGSGWYSCGIRVEGPITITSSTVNATGKTSNYKSSCGIYAVKAVTISGSTVTATGGTAGSGESSGIYAVTLYEFGPLQVEIKNATVTATGMACTSGISSGIFAESEGSKGVDVQVAIEDSTVTATGGTAGTGSYGILADSDTSTVIINGNSVVRANMTGEEGVDGEPISGKKTTQENSIVFENGDGTVHGNVTLQKDLTVAAGETLDIPSGTSLTIPEGTTLTNNGTITNSGTLINNGTLTIGQGGSLTGNQVQYTVTVLTDGSGSASASTTAAKAGETVTLTASPSSGYHFERWEVVFGGVTLTGNQFTMPASPVTVKAVFEKNPYIPPTYAVTVPETTGGTVTVSPSRASSGRRVTITTQPAPGYELESLTVLDSRGSEIALTDKGNGKYTFTMPASRVTVEASFAPVPLPFEDVPPGAWYESAVRYAYTHSIMEGMSATTFVPGKSLTRAEAVQVLYNLEGQPTVSGTATFPDLVYQWYKPAISWAESTGVVDGYEDGTFRPGQPVTREELAQMLYDYAAYKGYDLTAQGDLSSFPDGNEVQEWAVPAMAWTNGNELINGHDDGTLEPAGTTTRAQAASILMRFDQNVVEK